jgi:cation transport ATPase
MANQSKENELKRSSNFSTIVMSMSALFSSSALGIWLGLWSTHREAIPSWEVVQFALLIMAIPLQLPLITTFVSISMLQNKRYKRAGVILLVCSIASAAIIGLIVVPMGNF